MQFWREDCLQRLARPGATSEQVFAELADICAGLGFEFCSFGVRLPTAEGTPLESWSTTYPAAWRDRYLANNYMRIDPVIDCALRTDTPTVWSEKMFGGQRAFWEEARAHKVRHGWTTALHGRAGEIGLLSLARSDGPILAAELNEIEARLLWLAHTANAMTGASLAQGQAPCTSGELTAREREVLRWTAAGKTSAEIGVILGVATRTINFHVTSALVKLDAVNKTQAVVKAVMLDLLR
jgi:LuxR family transcriptional regulator